MIDNIVWVLAWLDGFANGKRPQTDTISWPCMFANHIFAYYCHEIKVLKLDLINLYHVLYIIQKLKTMLNLSILNVLLKKIVFASKFN